MRLRGLLMSNNIKLIRPTQYLIELNLKNTLYLYGFFDEDDFIKKEKTSDKTPEMILTCIDEDDDKIDEDWGSVESSEKPESSENSESLDFEKMNDEELIAYYNSIQPVEQIELGGYAPYRLTDYIYDYYVNDSDLVVNGKLFYALDVWDNNEKNINISMPTLIIDFEIQFDTTNVNSGRIEISKSMVKANMNNHISRNEALAAIVDDIVIIPFNSNSVLPKNVKLINSFKKDAFDFSDLQYTEYDWKPKPPIFNW